MALARLDIPGLVLYGGSIAPGRFQGRDVTIQDVFEAVGAHDAGTMSDADFDDLERHACPGAGACGGQFTANTMATVCETLGISPFGSASVPADRRGEGGGGANGRRAGHRRAAAAACGRARSSPAMRSRTPSPPSRRPAARPTRSCICWRLPTKRACRSTSTISIGSARRSRCWRDLKPGGTLRRDRPASCRRHPARRPAPGRRRACSTGDAITVTGRTIGEHARDAVETAGQQVVRPLDEPDQADRRPGDPQRQPRAGRRGRQGGRLRRQDSSRVRRACSTARRRRRRRSASGTIRCRRRRGDPLRGPARRARACARCSP